MAAKALTGLPGIGSLQPAAGGEQGKGSGYPKVHLVPAGAFGQDWLLSPALTFGGNLSRLTAFLSAGLESCRGLPAALYVAACLVAMLPVLPADVRADEMPQVDRPEVDWYVFDFPPVYILKGPDEGKGTADSRLKQLMAGLEGFLHKKVVASLSRLMADVSARDGVCSITMLRTPEREASLLFSRHFWRLETSRLLMRPDRQERYARYITPDGRIDLMALRADGDESGVYVANRSYTGAIDRYLKGRSGQQDQMMPVASNESAFRMLELGRADFTFGYPYELAYFDDSQHRGLDLVALPAVGDPLYVDGGIACSRGPVSARVIAAVDDLLDRQPTTPDVDEASRRWRSAVEMEPAPRVMAPTVTN
jgi:uncharacterized protein (TIGR02285 family)